MKKKSDGGTGRRGDGATIAPRSCLVRSPRRRVAASLLILVIATLAFSSCGSSRSAVPASAAMGTCPVCHMKVTASDEWASEIYFKDGTKLLFESPGDMLAFYTSPASYNVDDAHKHRAKIDRIMVKDYLTKQPIDALQARLAYKSKIDGPMGADFFPFAKRDEAEAFVAANGGTLLALNEVTGEMVRDLRK
jgi:nitrous oxide reductase accessory protein NosL